MRVRRGASLLALALFATLLSSLAALAQTAPSGQPARVRHALVLGISDYRDGGLLRLRAPVNDAQHVRDALSKPDLDFNVTLLSERDIRDKAAFMKALREFAAKVRPEDEVLFYFSGHGFNIERRPDKERHGNFYLLGDAKSQTNFLKDLPSGEARALDTQDRKNSAYEDYIARIAISEKEVEDELRTASVILIVADACRTPVDTGKGFVPVTNTGVSLARAEPSRNTFRLYSARRGQISLDAEDTTIVVVSDAKETKGEKRARPEQSSEDRAERDQRSRLSLFTAVFVRVIQTFPVEINYVAAKIKEDVKDRANERGQEQTPDYVDDALAVKYFFNRNPVQFAAESYCRTARTELAQLRFAVAAGSIGRRDLQARRLELARCGLAGEVEALIRMESQGAGVAREGEDIVIGDVPENAEPTQACDARASSPFDPNRPQQAGTGDIHKLALRAISGEADRGSVLRTIRQVVDACEAAARDRPRVARYKFNLARAHYAFATLTDNLPDRTKSLTSASLNLQAATDMGYAAAYNDLALLHQNGEFHAVVNGVEAQQPRNRDLAFQLLQRGANLGHTLALYNLGMAYRNAEIGSGGAAAGDSATTTPRKLEAQAFEFISKSAEGGYTPAVIQTALSLHDATGVNRDAARAVELLELAASRGSWEAMYWLGEIYSRGFMNHDPGEAIVWHARAAEAGETRSQRRLAEMLTEGTGLPAPQPEAAGRYWRLAADGGDAIAQFRLALLLRDGRIPARPRVEQDGPDGGGAEIRDLLRTAFAKGNPQAGLELGKLYRKGFPEGRPSKALPKDPKAAVETLLDTIELVRRSDNATDAGNPVYEYQAAAELISMNETGDSRRGNQNMITEDQISLLKTEFGADTQTMWIRAAAAGGNVVCTRAPRDTSGRPNLWVLIWNSTVSTPPVMRQFDWFERRHRCKQREAGDTKTKIEDLGVSQATRAAFRREYEAFQKDKDKKKSYVDRMVELVNKGSGSTKGRRGS